MDMSERWQALGFTFIFSVATWHMVSKFSYFRETFTDETSNEALLREEEVMRWVVVKLSHAEKIIELKLARDFEKTWKFQNIDFWNEKNTKVQ